MKTLELKPTYENLLECYENDCIGRNKDLHKFLNILDCVDDSCSIALDGRWGSGKTFFVKQAKLILEAFNPFISNNTDVERIKNAWKKYNPKEPDRVYRPQIAIYYDAWQNDNDDDPLISLIYNILHDVSTNYSFIKHDLKIFQLLSGIGELLTGYKTQNIISALKTEDPFSEIKKQKKLHNKIEEFFNELLPEQGERLLIFIDELDRCNPCYAVKLLERIKHYLNNDKITFIFSINALELQNTIKQHFGQNFDAYKYLDRFFDLRLTLPNIDLTKYLKTIGSDDFLERFNYNNIFINKAILQYHFSLREISKYVRLIKIASYERTNNKNIPPNDCALDFCLLCVVPVMIALKLHNINDYYDFIEGRNSDPLINIFDKNLGEAFSDWLFDSNEIGDYQKEIPITEFNSRLIEIYHALFIKEYTDRPSQKIGKMYFNPKIKLLLLRIESLLSDFSDFNY